MFCLKFMTSVDRPRSRSGANSTSHITITVTEGFPNFRVNGKAVFTKFLCNIHTLITTGAHMLEASYIFYLYASLLQFYGISRKDSELHHNAGFCDVIIWTRQHCQLRQHSSSEAVLYATIGAFDS